MPIEPAPANHLADRFRERRLDGHPRRRSLYEALSGQRPFTGASTPDVLYAIVHHTAPPLPDQVPLSLRDILEKVLLLAG